MSLILICTLISVTDGDTLRAACPQEIRIRIANIDAPEVDACPGPAARATEALRTLAQGPLTVRPLYTDRYGRTVATIEAQGADIGQSLITTGAAQPWPHSDRGRALTKKPRGC